MNLATGDDRLKIGITMGDLNGIGPELIIKTFADARMLDLCTPVIYGSTKVMSFYKNTVEVEQFQYTQAKSAQEAAPRKINVVNCWNEDVKIEPGQSTPNGGKYAVMALEAAVKDLQEGKIHALVTAPIDKSHLSTAGFNFPGHTEYLAEKGGGKGLMLMVNGKIRVALATGHVGVKDIASLITTSGIIEKLQVLNRSLQMDFNIRRPKIAVLALNPHAGDGGKFGDEEQKFIIPAIQKVKEAGIMAAGPFPADGFFASGNFEHYDAILSMYHDQGLVGFKTLSMMHGVNYTAGLNFIRTSPDHGPAFDLAGKDTASEASFREAVYLACDIYKTRMDNKEYSKNPLKSLSKAIEAKEDETLADAPEETIL